LVGVDELVREVLLGGVLPHLDSRSSDYQRVAGAWLQLHSEELPEQDPMGLDPQKSFAEVNEDGAVKNTVGVEVEVLDVVVPHGPLEEVARILIPGSGPPHVHLFLPDETNVEEG
jgi:hypothetical protein